MLFDGLREKLLKGGIAPRHVRRYLGELEDHLAELTASEEDAGYNPAEAAIRARAALGPDEELADAMLKQRDFRSLSARAPWLVFGIMPPLAVIASLLLCVFATMLAGVVSGAITPHHPVVIPLPLPLWFTWTWDGVIFAANFLIVAFLGALLAWMAQRQRMKLLWPLLGMGLILLLNLHGEFHADTKRIFISLGTIIPFKGPFGPGGDIHWPTFLEQAALLCLSLAWLWRARHKNASAQ